MSTDIVKIKTPKTFDEGVEQVASIHNQMRAHLMVGYWHIGNIISDMEDDEGKYGNRIIHRVSETLEGQGVKCGVRILQDAHRFFKTYPDEDSLKDLVNKQLDWSQAREILKLDKPADRKKVIDKAVKNKYTARDTKREVSSILNKDKVKKDADKMKKQAERAAAEDKVVDVEAVDTSDVAAPSEAEAPLHAPTNEGAKPIEGFESILKYLKDLDVMFAQVGEEIAKHPAYMKELESISKDLDKTTDTEYEAIVSKATEISEQASVLEQRMEGIKGTLHNSHGALKNAAWYT
jgi:hypothetical protein